MADEISLPLIDLSGYLDPKAPGDRERVIAEVRDACAQYGFFQATGHGISMALQKGLFQGMDNVFDMPTEEKLKLSFLNNKARRGYEASGMTLRDGQLLPDSKECYFVGREDELVENAPGYYGPNVWPPLPEDQFREPVWAYYEAARALARTIWEILLQGLGHPACLLDTFTTRPMVILKMLRYPPLAETRPDQFGAGAHTDSGGVTVLLQEPGRDGLEVWVEESKAWLPVKAVEDVYVINCGNIIHRWTGGRYQSALHRVINKADGESRKSCALFFQGDAYATNPFDPEDKSGETIGQLLVKRFVRQFSLPEMDQGPLVNVA